MRVFFINFRKEDEPDAARVKNLAFFSSRYRAFENITSNDLICLAFGGNVKWILSQKPLYSRKHGMCFIIDGAARCDFFVDDINDLPVTRLTMHFSKPENTKVYEVQLKMPYIQHFDPA